MNQSGSPALLLAAPARPVAQFHPKLWGDRFLNYTPPDKISQLKKEEEANKLKEEVRKKLGTIEDLKERLIFIDAIEQLGVAYHLEQQIEAILQQYDKNYYDEDNCYKDDLHYLSLRFRLLRQHGFYVSSDVFGKFKNEDGSFKESLTKDVLGILNFYQASYLRVHGEKILDEALEFTKSHLKSMVGKLNEPFATQVAQALRIPLHRFMPRVLSRYFISIYEKCPSNDKTLLRFAKLDFDLVQSLHKKELQELSRWWKCLDFSTKLSFARDRIVETYFWMSGVFYEPHYASIRTFMTKLFKMISIIDDTYDAYGLYDELVSFTEAIQRWDKRSLNHLPHYMKLIYDQLVDNFEGFEQVLAQDGKSHLLTYVREIMKYNCRCYLQEAKWRHEKYIPTYEEYLEEAAIVTSGNLLMCGAAFIGMGEMATKDALEWVSHNPKPVKASCTIGRLINDIVSHKEEQKRDHVASAIECYMTQYGVSEEKAIEEIYKEAEESWKDLNLEIIRPTKFAKQLMTPILNTARVIEVVYLFSDEYTAVSQNMQQNIQAIFIDSVTL